MASILSSLRNTVIAGFVLAGLLIVYFSQGGGFDQYAFVMWLFRWFHVLAGVMWIGLLWYFNFVQIPNMANIPAAQKPAISKVIAPAALWYFRWGAMLTIISGLTLAYLNGYLGEALTLDESNRAIGIGMYLGIIMFLNVWLVIWPNQRRALGLVNADDDTKARSARTAMLFSRTNTLLSIPMLVSMTVAQNAFA
jgi:uncharacterized membrane protein